MRDMPADMQRPERTRQVHISLAGSEFTLAVLLARFGIPAAYISRVPDNPYGWLTRDTAREQGVNTDYFVWAPKAEPIGRFIYEIGRTPRKNTGWYQRMYSAASRLDAGHGELGKKRCETAGCFIHPAFLLDWRRTADMNATISWTPSMKRCRPSLRGAW